MLENDRENVQEKPLALDRLCARPRSSNEGKLAITIEGIFPVGRGRSVVLEHPPESDYDRLWEGVEPGEGRG